MSLSPPAAGDDHLCRYLEWDSSFFGVRIARANPHTVSSADLNLIWRWCDSQLIDCLYFLAESDDRQTVSLLQDSGFYFVDIRMTMTCELPLDKPDTDSVSPGIRPALPSDIPALRQIARVSHRDSRFYYDGHFPSHRCDELYEIWIERSCKGYADVVLVAESEGLPVGYLSCHLKNDEKACCGEIGLVALSEAARGRGFGSNLVAAALDWFDVHGARRVSVVTQGRNIAAQRLYQRCKFVTDSVALWHHKWFHSGARG